MQDVYGGEEGHRSHTTLLKQYRLGCVFCAPAPELQLLRSADFGVVLDVAPLSEGHLLIHSTAHWSCAGEIPARLRRELHEMKDAVSQLLSRTYGAVSFYEHGRAGQCITDGPEHRLCHHFHMHAVPVDIGAADELDSRFQRLAVVGIQDVPDLYDAYGPYLYWENSAGSAAYYPVGEEIERHLLRTIVARRLGHPERADWCAYGDTPMLARGRDRLRAHTVAAEAVKR